MENKKVYVVFLTNIDNDELFAIYASKEAAVKAAKEFNITELNCLKEDVWYLENYSDRIDIDLDKPIEELAIELTDSYCCLTEDYNEYEEARFSFAHVEERNLL